VVAAIHVGWRGAAAGIVPAAIERARLSYGLEPGSAKAFLGPAVSASNYPVGPEVIEALSDWRLDRRRWLDGSRVDLRAFIAAQLEGLGVVKVDRVGPCTASTPGLASYRRDGAAAGRQWSLIYRRPTT
jgi:copper oxidase (laccase) domain-containing protein